MKSLLFPINKRFPNATIPNVITFGGLLFALIGIYLILNDQIIIAIIFLTITDVFDIADGYVARKFKMFSPLGTDLDSLVDVMAFIAPPFIIAIVFDNNILLISSVFMAGCGIYRLARFNAEKTASGYRKGVSISPPSHLIYTAILLNIVPVYLSILYIFFGIMMISSILIKKEYSTYFIIFIMIINLILVTTLLI